MHCHPLNCILCEYFWRVMWFSVMLIPCKFWRSKSECWKHEYQGAIYSLECVLILFQDLITSRFDSIGLSSLHYTPVFFSYKYHFSFSFGGIIVLLLQVRTQALPQRARMSLTIGTYLLKLPTQRNLRCVELHRQVKPTDMSILCQWLN